MPLLCVASPKGGVGKTTLAANLAWELARAGKQVMALDLDPQNALRLHFGMKLQNGHGVMPIMRQERHWKLALQQTPSSVLLLPHGRVEPRCGHAQHDRRSALHAGQHHGDLHRAGHHAG